MQPETSFVPAEPSDGCGPLRGAAATGARAGAWVLVTRGGCKFATKALYAQAAGARGLLLANSGDGPLFAMSADSAAYALVSLPLPRQHSLPIPLAPLPSPHSPSPLSLSLSRSLARVGIPVVMIAATAARELARDVDDGRVSFSKVALPSQAVDAASLLLVVLATTLVALGACYATARERRGYDRIRNACSPGNEYMLHPARVAARPPPARTAGDCALGLAESGNTNSNINGNSNTNSNTNGNGNGILSNSNISSTFSGGGRGGGDEGDGSLMSLPRTSSSWWYDADGGYVDGDVAEDDDVDALIPSLSPRPIVLDSSLAVFFIVRLPALHDTPPPLPLRPSQVLLFHPRSSCLSLPATGGRVRAVACAVPAAAGAPRLHTGVHGRRHLRPIRHRPGRHAGADARACALLISLPSSPPLSSLFPSPLA